MMKAMSMTFNQKGDDDYFIRLLSYLRSKFKENIVEMVPFRKNVILIKTDKNTYMIKGFQSNKRLQLQEAFTATLRKEGFLKTYLFVHPQLIDPLFFEGSYFGCMEYIPPNKIPFSFHSQKNMHEGLELLEQFHFITSTFETRYRTIIPRGMIFKKWRERRKTFSSNISHLKYFVNEAFITELMDWANWSLTGMTKDPSLFINEPFCVLHGDVAHHNFLRDSKGIVHLIDFDLISIGPPSLDYLQYANRILPNLDWSIDRLAQFSTFEKLLDKKEFLFALAFPADIFREWNRLIREGSYRDQNKYNHVMDLTIGQFYSRKRFVDTLKMMMN
jgi:hypothetical protein